MRTLPAFALVCVAGAGCSTPATAERVPDEGEAPVADAHVAPPCLEADDAALARGASDGRCPWILREHDDGIELTRGEVGGELRRHAGEWPESCDPRRCAAELHATRLGPAVLLVEAQLDSGMPAQVWFGRIADEGLVFEPLFVGEGVFSEGTQLGPSYSLVPAGCGERWGLVARARLGGASAEGPDEALTAAVGPLGGVSGEGACEDLGVPVP